MAEEEGEGEDPLVKRDADPDVDTPAGGGVLSAGAVAPPGPASGPGVNRAQEPGLQMTVGRDGDYLVKNRLFVPFIRLVSNCK